MSVAYNSKSVTDGLLACFDASNPKSYSPNVFPYPLDIYQWINTSSGFNSTLSRDTSTSPSPANGVPLKMVVNANDPYTPTYNAATWNVSSAVNGQIWCVSVYVKASVPTTGQIFLFGADVNGIVGSYYSIASKTFTVTTEWTRQEHYVTLNYATDVNIIKNIQFRLDGPDTAGQIVWWDGVQLELAQTATPFTPIVNKNSTNFKDLLSTYNATLYNYPAYNATNKSLTFDGSTDYGTASAILPSGQKQYTLSAWWRTTTNTGFHVIFEQNSSAVTTNTRAAIIQNATNWGFNGQSNDAQTQASITLNQWMYSVITVNSFLPAASNPIKIYQNGALVWQGDSSAGAANLNLSNQAFRIGRKVDNSESFQGDISNIAIYNRVLTPTEILQNFNALRGRYGL